MKALIISKLDADGIALLYPEFRRFNPWFDAFPDVELQEALLWGEPARCAEQLTRLREVLGLELPLIDLSGLDASDVERALDALPAGGLELTPSPALP
ncbi:MAG: hypothetical protein JRI55_22730 [Deltaproteobacteria bacterium]|nr:hypothetical protein [Deltaproteobacteria bacterium]